MTHLADPPNTTVEPASMPAAGPPKRAWALALGTAAVWYLDPVLVELAELIGGIALSNNKSLAKDAIAELRRKAADLRGQIGPLPASALAKVVRRTEAAGGAVLDKGARVKELQTSWDLFLACLRSSPKR
ncbi:hypothetical protein [Polaromonas sp.]|uniref:hypothetical protein n=1 Tax=Polaromonas sp. TaxID=1869339 RepID=UPI00375278DA